LFVWGILSVPPTTIVRRSRPTFAAVIERPGSTRAFGAAGGTAVRVIVQTVAVAGLALPARSRSHRRTVVVPMATGTVRRPKRSDAGSSGWQAGAHTAPSTPPDLPGTSKRIWTEGAVVATCGGVSATGPIAGGVRSTLMVHLRSSTTNPAAPSASTSNVCGPSVSPAVS
jgi:hypothetical protein